jgi:DNA-binding SARP family transcriptional activator
MLRLITFGGLALDAPDEAAVPRVRPIRLALLTVVAAAGERGISRERLASLLWSDSDENHARHSLRQTLYRLREELGVEVLKHGSTIALDTSAASADVFEFRAALSGGNREGAVALVRGPFLDGFYLPSAPAFERWVEDERARLRTATMQALASLAADAHTAGRAELEVEWWRRLTEIDALNGRFALGFLKALAARGDRARALAFAREHEAVVRRELEADPDPGVQSLVAALRTMTVAVDGAPAAPRVAVEPGHPGTGQPDAAAVGERTAQPGAPPVRRRRNRVAVGTASVVALAAVAAVTLRSDRLRRPASLTPTFAVGFIHEQGVPDTLRIGGVLTDMLATNLARVEGLQVLANSRLFELMRPGQERLASGYADAARRAGATELLEGSLLAGPAWGLALEIRRVDLRTGLLRGAYRVSANDRYALIDSATAAIARGLRLATPGSSVADATTGSPIAYRLYEEGLRAYYQDDPAASRRLMKAALAEDSTFAMAAYYYAQLLDDMRERNAYRRSALRLAQRASDRERLWITADILTQVHDTAAHIVAESLTTRFAGDPRAWSTLAVSYRTLGDWAAAARAFERAVAIDSAAEPADRATCHLCEVMYELSDTYQWWDSLSASERIAHRLLRLRPGHRMPWTILATTAARNGRDSAALAAYRRLEAASPVPIPGSQRLRILTTLERYSEAEREALRLLGSSRPEDSGQARWFLIIVLRNQGRLEDAWRLVNGGAFPGLPEPLPPLAEVDASRASVAAERGDTREAGDVYRRALQTPDTVASFPGLIARLRAWNAALWGTVLAAAGDTAAARALADSAAFWGQRSGFGRDRKVHHFLRGLVHAAAGRDDDAIREYRAAIYSWSLGYTRINYELARALLRRSRPHEAVAALQPALRGEVDAANLWITRTDLHELLAQAFDRAGRPDSAAAHYRAVVSAWVRADPRFHARRDSARRWLSQRGSGGH